MLQGRAGLDQARSGWAQRAWPLRHPGFPATVLTARLPHLAVEGKRARPVMPPCSLALAADRKASAHVALVVRDLESGVRWHGLEEPGAGRRAGGACPEGQRGLELAEWPLWIRASLLSAAQMESVPCPRQTRDLALPERRVCRVLRVSAWLERLAWPGRTCRQADSAGAGSARRRAFQVAAAGWDWRQVPREGVTISSGHRLPFFGRCPAGAGPEQRRAEGPVPRWPLPDGGFARQTGCKYRPGR